MSPKEKIYAEDLQDYIKITHADIENHRELDHKGGNTGGKPEKTIYVYERGSQFDLLTNVPTTYMWVSPIPESVLEKNGLVQRACKASNHRYKDVLIYRQDYKLGEYDKLFHFLAIHLQYHRTALCFFWHAEQWNSHHLLIFWQ